jgi:hypothetical protein
VITDRTMIVSDCEPVHRQPRRIPSSVARFEYGMEQGTCHGCGRTVTIVNYEPATKKRRGSFGGWLERRPAGSTARRTQSESAEPILSDADLEATPKELWSIRCKAISFACSVTSASVTSGT